MLQLVPADLLVTALYLGAGVLAIAVYRAERRADSAPVDLTPRLRRLLELSKRGGGDLGEEYNHFLSDGSLATAKKLRLVKTPSGWQSGEDDAVWLTPKGERVLSGN